MCIYPTPLNISRMQHKFNCVDTGWSLEDLTGAIDDRMDGEKVRKLYCQNNFMIVMNRFELRIFETSCHTKVKKHSLPNYLPYSWSKNSWVHIFPKGISTVGDADNLNQDLNSGCHVHFS